jgi:phage protein U
MPLYVQDQIRLANGGLVGAAMVPIDSRQWGGSRTLYSWGTVQFEVHPLNVHEVDHSTATDWAKKEIAGAAIYREWVGENDEELFFRGRLFPYRIGGLENIEAVEAMRRGGMAEMLVRGDGRVLGWYVIERMVRQHTFLAPDGVGQVIHFEAIFVRVPVPAADEEFAKIWRMGV